MSGKRYHVKYREFLKIWQERKNSTNKRIVNIPFEFYNLRIHFIFFEFLFLFLQDVNINCGYNCNNFLITWPMYKIFNKFSDRFKTHIQNKL